MACVQNAYSVADRSDQAVFDACAADGVPYVPYFPLGSAFFAEKPVLGAPAVVATADRLGATPAQVALAWLLHAWRRPCCSSRGPRRSAHLEENLAAADLVLDERAVGALTDLG